jgi:transcriptional regulator with XRE-family HTH domain
MAFPSGGSPGCRTPCDLRPVTDMLTTVDNPGQWIREGRAELCLSIRELAALAGVSYPTISRIENGHEQPRWATLQKIMHALGRTLEPTADQTTPGLRLADLAEKWTIDATGKENPDWTRLRAFADQLALHPERTATAIAESPMPSGSLFIDNLLAAIAEKTADDMGIKRPEWTRRYPPLSKIWESPGTPRLRAENAANTPPQFKARGMLIPAAAIWRDRQLTPP